MEQSDNSFELSRDNSVPGCLAERKITPAHFLPFIREIEQSAVSNGVKPVFVYWSTHSACRLIPTGPRFRDLMRDAHCVSIFSESDETLTDECVFCVFSEQGSVFIEMRRLPEPDLFKCFGYINTRQTVARMSPLLKRFRHLDATETDRLVYRLSLLSFKETADIFDSFSDKWQPGTPGAMIFI